MNRLSFLRLHYEHRPVFRYQLRNVKRTKWSFWIFVSFSELYSPQEKAFLSFFLFIFRSNWKTSCLSSFGAVKQEAMVRSGVQISCWKWSLACKNFYDVGKPLTQEVTALISSKTCTIIWQYSMYRYCIKNLNRRMSFP